jgi:hypothetical protein
MQLQVSNSLMKMIIPVISTAFNNNQNNIGTGLRSRTQLKCKRKTGANMKVFISSWFTYATSEAEFN